MKKIIKNPRKGVTMAELIIALGIIMVVIIASISMLKSSVTISAKSSAIIEANKTAESIIECFNFAPDKEKFKIYLGYLHGNCVVEQDGNVTEYEIDCGSYRIEIIYIEGKNLKNIEYSKIEINAIYGVNTPIFNNKLEYYKYKG